MGYKHMHHYVNECAGWMNIQGMVALEKMAALFRGMDSMRLTWRMLAK